MTHRKTIGIIGYGNFSKFIAPILAIYFDVFIYVRQKKQSELAEELKTPQDFSLTHPFLKNNFNQIILHSGTKENLTALDYCIFSVPLQSLAEVCETYKNTLSEKTILIDVTSVKVRPIEILKKYFPKNQILGTHPIFGPQSGKNGIENLPMVLCNESATTENYLQVKNFLSEILQLNIIEKSAEDHDKEMAMVQGLSHFIGRALSIMNIETYDTATKSYKQLVHLKELLQNDSWELYKTIQNGNPYTEEIRKEFLTTLTNLEKKLESEK